MKYWFLIIALGIAGCAGPRMASEQVSAGDAQFNRVADEALNGYLAWRPLLAVSLGLHEYDGKAPDFSAASVEAERQRLKGDIRRLQALNRASLSSTASYDYRILLAGLQGELFRFEDLASYTLNPMTYGGALDVNTYLKRDFAPFDSRVRSIVVILGETPRLMAAARANLADVLPKPYVETAIEVTKGSADFLAKDLVTAVTKDLKDPSLMATFTAVNDRAIMELRDYAKYLETEKLPKANAPYALGRDKFQKMLREQELISLTPERVLEIGTTELRRAQELFAETARKIDPNHPAVEVFKAIQKDHPTADGLITDVSKHLELIRQFLVDHHIVTLPSSVRAKVEPTPQYERATSFASMDSPGPFEKKATEAYYYVTPTEPEWPAQQKEEWLTAFNYYTTDAVSIHEAYPSHYTQFLHLQASPATKIEKIFGSYAFIEGWAHYTEQMMMEEGYGAEKFVGGKPEPSVQAAKYRLAQLDEALLRLCRLCVSIKTHCEGMDVEAATRFFQDNCYYEAKPAHDEAMRGTFDPGYLFYTVGKLQILKLREDYRRQEGAAFSLKRFHDAFLEHGMPPVRLLRELLLTDKSSWEQIL